MPGTSLVRGPAALRVRWRREREAGTSFRQSDRTIGSMMRTAAICLTALAFLPVCASASYAQSLAACRKTVDKEARLSCYDAIAAAEAAAPARDGIVKVDQVVGPSAPVSFSVADLRQMARTPALYVNKPLVFSRMRCIYSDVNDYRCRPEAAENVEIRAPIIVPPPVQSAVEARSGTV